MTFQDIVFGSALGQILAIAIVVVAWAVWNLWLFLKTFAAAASQVRVKMVCERKASAR